MIPYFRKIRQSLLKEGKIGNYLKYALGEIVLVVIGILIAVAINEKQQLKTIEDKEQTYLLGLKEEFQISKAKLTALIGINKQNYSNAETILSSISNEGQTLDEKQFSELLYHSFASDIYFNANNALLYEMINSGSLKDISNRSLRVQLTNWQSTLEDIGRQEAELGRQRAHVLDLFRTESYSLKTVFELANPNTDKKDTKPNAIVSNLGLLNSLKFENNVLLFYSISKSMESTHYEPLMKELNGILNLLESEIQ
jgi:hypothetical protein